MLPNNRVLAACLTVLLLAQVMPLVAAQTGGADLYTTSVTLGSEFAVQSVPVRVDVTVTNLGNAQSNAFEVVVYEGAIGTLDCLDRGDSNTGATTDEPRPSEGCVRREPIGIAARASKTYFFNWTPSVNQGGAIPIWTQIRPIGDTGFTSPDPAQNAQNNARSHPDLFVNTPGVDITPLRQPAPHDGNVNSVWRAVNITQACPQERNTVVEYGCKVLPGQTLLYHYNVINLGNSADTFTPSFQGTTTYVNKGYAFRFGTTGLTIPSNQTAILPVYIEVPLNAEANDAVNVGTMTASITLASKYNPSVRPPQNSPVPSLLVNETRGLTLTAKDNQTLRIANVSQIVTWEINLNNSGNVQDTYAIRYLHGSGSINGSWGIPTQPLFVTVPKNSRVNYTLTLSPPANATKGLHTVDIEVQSTSTNDPSAYAKMTLQADLQQRYLINGSIATNLLNRVPAEPASFLLAVKNEGNWYDNVTLTLENAPPGWNAQLSQRLVPVAPFGTTYVHLNVTPPPNSPKNMEATFFVNGTSSGPLDVAQRAQFRDVKAIVRVTEGPSLLLTNTNVPTFVDPGSTMPLTVRIVNTGNVQDNFTIGLTRDNAAWTATATPSYAVLAPLQAADIVVTLRAPSTGSVGEAVDVVARVLSTVDRSLEQSTTLTGRISGPDLFVDNILVNSSNPYAGDPLEINVAYGNSGNKAPTLNTTLVLLYAQGGSERILGEITLTPRDLAPGVRRSERFVWPDTLNAEGSGILIARIDPADATGTTLVEEIDETAASNERTRAVTLRTFDLRLRAAESLTGRPGEQVDYAEAPNVFIVEYRGNQADEPVLITVESAHGWTKDGKPQQLSVRLVRGNELRVTANVFIPLEPGTPSDTLTVTVTPTLRPTSALVATTTTSVTDDVAPRITDVTATPQNFTIGERVTLRATVTDATGLRLVRAHVVGPDNATTTIPMTREEGNTWAVTQAFTVAGLHRIYVEAVDGSTAANTNTTRDTLVSFTVKPGSAPVIQLAAGQSATVRSGTPVKLDITDPLGIATARYTLRGIDYALSLPYTIDTSSFPEGAHEVNVTAANIYGAETTQKITLTIDNTPPGITSVTATPEKPRVNEDVTLRIETDPRVQQVDVVVKRNGAILETRTATKKSDGIFELQYAPEEGNYAFDVSAKDPAGNTQVKETAVVFSAKPASLLPAPGLVASALAILGAAVLIARRRRD